MARLATISLALVLALLVGRPADACRKSLIRVAYVAGRGSEFHRRMKQLKRRVESTTQRKWSLKLYDSGTAGDEPGALRKVRNGCLDAVFVNTTSLAGFVPGADIDLLQAPNLIADYRQYEAVVAEFAPDWRARFEAEGFRLFGFRPLGQYRWFSREKLTTLSQLKGAKRWRWPSSPRSEWIDEILGGGGQALGLNELYAGTNVGLVEVFEATPITLVELKLTRNSAWHASRETFGVASGVFVLGDHELPPEVLSVFYEASQQTWKQDLEAIQRADANALAAVRAQRYKHSEADDGKVRGASAFSQLATKLKNLPLATHYEEASLARVRAAIARGASP